MAVFAVSFRRNFELLSQFPCSEIPRKSLNQRLQIIFSQVYDGRIFNVMQLRVISSSYKRNLEVGYVVVGF